jgi:uncharacterized protein YegP (UPF0339 family)
MIIIAIIALLGAVLLSFVGVRMVFDYLRARQVARDERETQFMIAAHEADMFRMKIAALAQSIYQAPDGWRWRLKAANGRIIADGGEAYSSRSGAVRAVARLKQLVGQLA